MGDENVVLYDESSPLEQTRRSILHYLDRPEDTPTYLVELPEKRIDAPRPSTQPTSRPRRSTIINTLQVPDTREAEEEPLEDYVRRNLPSFRKSLAPEDLQQLTTINRSDKESLEGGEVVSPATAEDIERDLMDSKNRKNKKKESLDAHENRDSLPEGKPQKRKVTYQDENPPEPKPHNHSDARRLDDHKKSNIAEKTQKTSGKASRPHSEHSHNKNEVVVMAALEPVSVSQRSPFSNGQKIPSSSSNNHLVSPVKLKVSVESTDDESLEDERHGGKHHSKRNKRDPSPGKRKSPNELDEDLFEEGKKRHKKLKHRQQTGLPTKDSEESKDQDEKNHKRRKRRKKENPEDAKRGKNELRESSGRSSDDEKHRSGSFRKGIHSRSSSVCLSGESEENSSGPFIRVVNKPTKKENQRGSDSFGKNRIPSGNVKGRVDSSEKNRTNSAKDRPNVEKSYTKDTKGPPRSTEKQDRKSNDLAGHSKTTNPFGKEEPYSVYVATKGGAGKKPNTNPETNKQKKKEMDKQEKKDMDKQEKKGKKDRQEKKGEDAAKNLSLKAPRSSKKVVAMRRYHIQIPEPGQPETWFNVRFNMNAENRVEMNYDGPVKINNYYASNNFI